MCLAEYKEEEKIVILPCDARHNFHEACIKEWLRKKNECPICRSSITEAILNNFSMEQMKSKLQEESFS